MEKTVESSASPRAVYTVLGITLAGCWARQEPIHSVYSNGVSSVSKISVYIPDLEIEKYFVYLTEGGTVIDKRSIESVDIITDWVVKGPMLDETLPPDTKKVLFQGELACTDAKDCSGIESVSLNLYCQLWESLGAKIGKRAGNTIEWSNGEKYEIK